MKIPRQARKKSESGIYHVMLRGINQQQIFEEDEDYVKFLQIVEDYQAISKYKVYAYCLMSNHIHLLIREEEESLDIEENKPQRVTDEQAKAIIRKCSKCDTIADFQLLDRKTRDEYLRLFKEKGISIRQISRLTGVSYYIVQKI